MKAKLPYDRPCVTCGRPYRFEDFLHYPRKFACGTVTERRDPRCRECNRARKRAHYRKSKASYLAKTREWRQNNRERDSLRTKLHRRTPEGRAPMLAAVIKRNLAKINRTPSWADQAVIQAHYRLAAAFSQIYTKHHVDHIIPLQGKRVSGLHVENNLRVIPAEDNMKKHNAYVVA